MNAESDRLGPYFKALVGESDRGIVILSAAHIDDLLRDLLEAFFVEDSKVARMVLESDGPLGSFSSRMKVAFCLGFLTSEELADAELIRRCRNDAAHVANTIDFSDKSSPLTQRCSSFQTLTERTKETTPEMKDRFMLVAAWLATKVGHMRETVARRSPPVVPDNMMVLTNRAVQLWVGGRALVDHGRERLGKGEK